MNRNLFKKALKPSTSFPIQLQISLKTLPQKHEQMNVINSISVAVHSKAFAF